MKKFLLGSAIVICNSISAQEITYFDANWKVVKSKKEATYYRELKPQGNLTLMKDYYMNGVLQFEGLVSDATPGKEIHEGKSIWYYPNGKTQIIANFKKGKAVGEEKSFDEEGNITRAGMYNDKEQFTGKDIQEYNDIKEESIFKDGNLVKENTYSKTKKGIRYETTYSQSSMNTETKYYGEDGKYIGSLIVGEDGKTSGVEVVYYDNPMQISCINKLSGNDNDYYSEKKCYYENGKLKYDYISDGKNAKEISYSEDGKKLGELLYYLNEYNSMEPFEGENIIMDIYNPKENILVHSTYKNGMIVKRKEYENGKIAFLINYHPKNKEEIEKVISYKDEKEIAQLVYQNGMPYNGTILTQNPKSGATYQNSKLIEFYEYDTENYPLLEKKWIPSQKHYEVKVYKNKKSLYYYTTPFDSHESELFTAEITPYDENGKALNKVNVKDGIIEKGKLKILFYDGNYEEFERKGQWLYKRVYKEKELISEKKVKYNNNPNDELLSEFIIYEYNFLPEKIPVDDYIE